MGIPAGLSNASSGLLHELAHEDSLAPAELHALCSRPRLGVAARRDQYAAAGYGVAHERARGGREGVKKGGVQPDAASCVRYGFASDHGEPAIRSGP